MGFAKPHSKPPRCCLSIPDNSRGLKQNIPIVRLMGGHFSCIDRLNRKIFFLSIFFIFDAIFFSCRF
jgi:hypothetical protein